MREPYDHDDGVTARGEDQNNCIAVTLITAKAKVAPTKTESVSRLELAACVIGTRLGLTVAHALNLDKSTIIGAAIFGIGWGLCGVCPGPAIASIGSGNFDLLWALVGIFIGSYIQGIHYEITHSNQFGILDS